MATLPTSQSGILLAGNASPRSRRDSLEFWGAFTLVALAVWTPPLLQMALSAAALLFIAWSTIRTFPGWRSMGLRVTQFSRSLWVLLLALGLAAAALALASRLGTLQLPTTADLFLHRYTGYALWSCLQEFLLLNFFLSRLLRLTSGKHIAALAAAALFALVHLPNPVLAPLTALWGYLSCLLFLRYRNLYVPAAVHALLGITIALTIPASVDHNMRVGLGYLDHPPLIAAAATAAWSNPAPTRSRSASDPHPGIQP